MKRRLLPTAAFLRSARRLAKKKPSAAEDLEAALTLLAEDVFHPVLKAHKLKGKLALPGLVPPATICASFFNW